MQLIDVDELKAPIAAGLGVEFDGPADANDGCDLVIHASASSAGLTRSLALLATDGRVVDLSWYGDRAVTVPLGEDFHVRRLTIRSSQVGTVSPATQGRRSYADRLALSLALLADPAFDVLLTGTSAFEELPALLPRLVDGSQSALCHVVNY